MELVRVAQEARRAKLELAAPPVASSASESEDQQDEEEEEEEGLQVDEGPQPVALPPSTNLRVTIYPTGNVLSSKISCRSCTLV